jgi:hypothetical protein
VRLWRLLLTLISVLLWLPAGALACPQWSSVKAFAGSADTAFTAAASGSDDDGGTVTVELDRSGSVNIDLPARTPTSGSTFTEFLGGTGGGTLQVNDTYADSIGGPSASGEQTADGPGVSDGVYNLAFLDLNPTSCTYQLEIEFAVPTTSSGAWPMPPDPGAGGVATTPQLPIPANLKLSGSADLPAYYDGCAGSSPVGGCYQMSGFEGGYAWAQELDMLDTCGSVVASNCTQGNPQEGTASYSWNISPASSTAESCSVGSGGVTSAARPGPDAGIADEPTVTCTCNADMTKCTCAPSATCKSDEDPAKKDAKSRARTGTYLAATAAGVFGVVAAVAAAIPGGQPQALVYVAGAGAFGLLATHLSFVAGDPPDPDWRSIFTPRPIGPTRVTASRFLNGAGAAALSGILRQMATVNGLLDAFSVSYDRRTSASQAKNGVWSARQTAAMGRYAIQSAAAIGTLVTQIRRSQASLSPPLPPLTPQALKQAAAEVAAHGLPRSLTSLWSRYGLPAALLASTKRRVEARTPLPSSATSIYGILSRPTFLGDLQSEADALQSYGELLLAVG